MQESAGKKPQRMVRKQILLTPDQNRRLKARARATEQAESELVRQGIDLALAAHETESRRWREKLEQFLQGEPFDAAFEERIRENKRVEREAWRKRHARTRRSVAAD